MAGLDGVKKAKTIMPQEEKPTITSPDQRITRNGHYVVDENNIVVQPEEFAGVKAYSHGSHYSVHERVPGFHVLDRDELRCLSTFIPSLCLDADTPMHGSVLIETRPTIDKRTVEDVLRDNHLIEECLDGDKERTNELTNFFKPYADPMDMYLIARNFGLTAWQSSIMKYLETLSHAPADLKRIKERVDRDIEDNMWNPTFFFPSTIIDLIEMFSDIRFEKGRIRVDQ
jgi:hypothetical protein